MGKIRGKVIFILRKYNSIFFAFFTLFSLGQDNEIDIKKSRKYWKFAEKRFLPLENTILYFLYLFILILLS